jgi:dephospho-CoA kinase
VAVANELRAQHSPSFIVEELCDIASKSGGSCIIESIRTVGEVDALKRKHNVVLLSVDADRSVRYMRIYKRSSETDNVSYEEFCANEDREMVSKNPCEQNLSACMAAADISLLNTGTLEDLHRNVDAALDL